MLVNCSKDSQACTYDVIRDGGSIGVYRLGLFLEEFSFVTSMVMQNINTAFASATSLATVSIGAINYNNQTVSPDYYFTSKVITNPIFASSFDMDVPNNRRTPSTVELVLVVRDEDLTAGNLIICVDYFNTDL